MLKVLVLLQSTSSRSCISNAPNVLVAATLLKLSRVFHLNVTNHVREEDEVLWAEFEMAFADAWMDTSKKQNAEHAQKCVCKFRGAEMWD